MNLENLKDVLLYDYLITQNISPGEANNIILLNRENNRLKQENEILKNCNANLEMYIDKMKK